MIIRAKLMRLALIVSIVGTEVVKKKRAMRTNTKRVNKRVKMCGKLLERRLKKPQKKRECGSEPGRGGQKRQRLTWRERMGGGRRTYTSQRAGAIATKAHSPTEAAAKASRPIIHRDTAKRLEMFPVLAARHNSSPPRLRGDSLLKHRLLSPRVASQLSSLPSVCL